MTTKTPEEILTIIVSGLLTERRFKVWSTDGNNDNYTLHIAVPSRNQGRILGAGRSNLNAIKSVMSYVDEGIEVILENPDESVEMNTVVTKTGLAALTPWLHSVTGDLAKAEQINNKIIISNGRGVHMAVQGAATILFFAIGRAQDKYAEVIWE